MHVSSGWGGGGGGKQGLPAGGHSDIGNKGVPSRDCSQVATVVEGASGGQ